jgi:hypothetical protein
MMLKKALAAAVAVPFLATVALAEGCNYQKTAQTPAPVAAAPQTPVPAADPVKVDVAEAPKPAQPKTN